MEEKKDGRRVKKPWLAELNRARTQDLTGRTFNALTVLYRAENRGHKVMWHCKCACGREIDVWQSHLKEGQKSCGCMTKQLISESSKTHGESNTRLYSIWHRMRDRCNNPRQKDYDRYGGRGIQICEEWNDYEAFKRWAIQAGYDENAPFMQCTIDRINNNKGYSPDNCRWATAKEQANNRSSNHWMTYHGETHNMSEWADITGIDKVTIMSRLRRGWSDERALSEPVHRIKKRRKV